MKPPTEIARDFVVNNPLLNMMEHHKKWILIREIQEIIYDAYRNGCNATIRVYGEKDIKSQRITSTKSLAG